VADTSRSTYVVVPFIVLTATAVGLVMAVAMDRWVVAPFAAAVGVVLALLYWVIDRYNLD
jgi:glucan phosphoethanolaminetransferase (alkaline phosphatase superfamily)